MDTTKTIQDRSAFCGCVASATGDCIAKNDRLIAAAPDLYEALEEMYHAATAQCASKAEPKLAQYAEKQFTKSIHLASAALTKATGEGE